MDQDTELNAQLQERFAKLPKVVQDAITSADVEAHLRELSEKHKLHLDQWELLENEVMLALLGFQPTAELAQSIVKQVHVDAETAKNLAADISTIVFEPIRQELERELDHPQAVAVEKTGVERVRDQMLASEKNPAPVPAPQAPVAVAPATPPNPAPQVSVERTTIAPAYTPSVPSHERKAIEGDPYREQIA